MADYPAEINPRSRHSNLGEIGSFEKLMFLRQTLTQFQNNEKNVVPTKDTKGLVSSRDILNLSVLS
jgi:hypothetical protein